MNNESGRRLKTVETTCRIIDLLKTESELGVTEVADRLDMSKGSAHAYLATLQDSGLVQRGKSGYRLGFWFITLGESVRHQTQLYHEGRPVVEALAEEVGDWAHLVVESQGREVSLFDAPGPRETQAYHQRLRQSPQYLHYSASGKSILAHYSAERREAILSDYQFVKQTGNTITDIDAFREELAVVRDQGFAWSDEEEMEGMRSVGAPIRVDGSVIGAISVSGPRDRLSDDRFRSVLPEKTRNAANVVEVRFNTSTHSFQ